MKVKLSNNLTKSKDSTIRLNSRLMVVRAFGDWDLDRPVGVIGREPDIYSDIQLESEDVIIISSDGLFEDIYKTGIRGGRDSNEIVDDVNMFFSQSNEKSLSKFLHDSHINKMTDKYITLYKQNPINREEFVNIITKSNDNNAILSLVI